MIHESTVFPISFPIIGNALESLDREKAVHQDSAHYIKKKVEKVVKVESAFSKTAQSLLDLLESSC